MTAVRWGSMKSVLLEIAAAAMILLIASSTQAATVKDIFEKYDLLGALAADCSKPADAKSPYVVNRVIDADHVQLDKMVGSSSREFAAIIDKASESKSNEIALSYTIDDKRYNLSVQVERGRMRIMESARTTGEKDVAGGRLTDGGAPTPSYTRCLQKVTIHSAPEGGGKCIESLNGEIKGGVHLQTWECNDTPPEIFAFDALNARLTIGELCVDTEGGRTHQGVNLALTPCNGAQTQSFKIEPNGNYVRLVGIGGFCVDIDGQYKGSGAVVHLWKCGTTPNQAWQFSPALDLTLEESTWHDGHQIADFVLPGADAKLCQASCIYNHQCTSWNYRKPEGRTDHQPHCWLLDKTAKVTRGDAMTMAGIVRPEAK